MYYSNNTFPMLAMAMSNLAIGLLIALVVIIILLALLYRFGTKLQKRQETAQTQMQANSQTVSMLVIDKKRVKLADSGLPKIVMEQTPKYMRRSKLPIAKCKIGPQILSMICDEKVYDILPVKKEVKAVISGIYIMGVKGLHSSLEAKPEKKSFWKRLQGKAQKKLDEANADAAKADAGKSKKKKK